MAKPILEAKNISKSFGKNNVLENIDISFYSGEVHALLGVNGAGKSTLVKILQGVYQPDQGDIILNGEKVVYKEPADALAQGILMVFQELNVFGEMSVTENIIGNNRIKKNGFIDWKACNKAVRDHLDKLAIHIDETAKVKDLSLANQQLVEIARCVYKNPKIIFLDEPSSSLSAEESKILYKLINDLRDIGICVVLITHKMEEVFKLSDHLSILRDGHITASGKVSEFDVTTITNHMLGKTVDVFQRQAVVHGDHSKTIFECQDLSVARKFEHVSFKLYSKEILAFAGLVGSGKSDLARTIFGINGTRYEGKMFLDGKEYVPSAPYVASKSGVGHVPISRKEEGILTNFDAKGNISSAILDKLGFFLDQKKEKDISDRLIKEYNVQPPNPAQNITNFSGGNQQKIVLTRWVAGDKKMIVLDEPTRGVDVGAKQEIYNNLRKLAEQGIGVVIFSSETDELLSSSDRIIIMREGKIVKELVTAETTSEEILTYSIAEQEG